MQNPSVGRGVSSSWFLWQDLELPFCPPSAAPRFSWGGNSGPPRPCRRIGAGCRYLRGTRRRLGSSRATGTLGRGLELSCHHEVPSPRRPHAHASVPLLSAAEDPPPRRTGPPLSDRPNPPCSINCPGAGSDSRSGCPHACRFPLPFWGGGRGKNNPEPLRLISFFKTILPVISSAERFNHGRSPSARHGPSSGRAQSVPACKCRRHRFRTGSAPRPPSPPLRLSWEADSRHYGGEGPVLCQRSPRVPLCPPFPPPYNKPRRIRYLGGGGEYCTLSEIPPPPSLHHTPALGVRAVGWPECTRRGWESSEVVDSKTVACLWLRPESPRAAVGADQIPAYSLSSSFSSSSSPPPEFLY